MPVEPCAVRRPVGICPACSRSRWSRARFCRRRNCPGYAPLWAGDQRRKLFDNLKAYTDGSGYLVMLTVTAPGAGELPWDREHCRRLGEHTCSGLLGCRVDSAAREAWNKRCPDQWRRLHRRVYQSVNARCKAPWMLARVYEMQHRGVLHIHPVIAFGTPGEKAAAHLYVKLLHELAPRYGFGIVDRKLKPMTAGAAAAYLSAYFVTGKKEKAALHESVMSQEMPRSIIHVSNKLTQRTGVTMRELRFRRYVWTVAPGLAAMGMFAAARAVTLYHQEHGEHARSETLIAILRAHEDPEP